MGGMIVLERLAIDHPDRLLSVTSVMSRTGEPGYGDSSQEALAFLIAPPAESGDRPTSTTRWPALARVRIEAGVARRGSHRAPGRPRAYDRCFCPAGIGRQMKAVGARRLPHRGAGQRSPLPVLVIHGSRDTLIDPSGGRRTAEEITQVPAISGSTAWGTTTPQPSGPDGSPPGRNSPTPASPAELHDPTGPDSQAIALVTEA